VSSGKVGEDALSEVLILAAAEDDVGNGLSPLSTAAAGAGYVRNVSIEEKVVESDLLGLQLHQQRALPIAEPLVELKHLLGGRWCVPIRSAAFLFFPPCADPRSICLHFAPSSERRPEWV
jgi:hypothetical protein